LLNNRNYLYRTLGEILTLRFPAPDEESEIRLMEEEEEDEVEDIDEDPNSQDRSS